MSGAWISARDGGPGSGLGLIDTNECEQILSRPKAVPPVRVSLYTIKGLQYLD